MLLRAQRLGFLGPGPVDEHLEHAIAFARAVPAPRWALDLGSGGGLPGLPLARRWMASQWALLDSNERRAAFLEQAVGELGLSDRVRVVGDRAERAAHIAEWRGAFDVVVARSFGRPAVTAECACGFLRVGGHLLVSEPPQESDARWAIDGLASLGLVDRGLVGRVRLLEQVDVAPVAVPRRVGVPAKHPAW